MKVFQHCGFLDDQCGQEFQLDDLDHQCYDGFVLQSGDLVLQDDDLVHQHGDPDHQHDLDHQDCDALVLQNDEPDHQDDGPDHQREHVHQGGIGLDHQGDGLDHQGGDDLVHPHHEQEASGTDCEGEEQVDGRYEDQDGDGGGMVDWL